MAVEYTVLQWMAFYLKLSKALPMPSEEEVQVAGEEEEESEG